MLNPVMIKGNKHGITLVLDSELPYPKLFDRIRMKFKESAKFFDSNSQMAITFEGRELSNEEQEHIIELINECCDLNITYIIEKDITEQVMAAQIASMKSEDNNDKSFMDDEDTHKIKETADDKTSLPDKSSEKKEILNNPVKTHPKSVNKAASSDNSKDENNSNEISSISAMDMSDDLGHFYRGTLRSGQSIEFASSIVVIGDVNPGAKVVAKGNIIVIGSLKGAAYAGVNGSPNSFIIALDMDPKQLRIGDLYARSPDSKNFLKKKKQPSKEMQIAFVENDNIYIEPINRSVLNNFI